jgi:hypothetical protein
MGTADLTVSELVGEPPGSSWGWMAEFLTPAYDYTEALSERTPSPKDCQFQGLKRSDALPG